jgi:hypothetical protein
MWIPDFYRQESISSRSMVVVAFSIPNLLVLVKPSRLVITDKCQSPRERMLAGKSERGSGDENGSNTCQ